MNTNKKNNRDLYPEAWLFFVEHARNIENEKGSEYKYCIPKPDMSGNFIYANCPGALFMDFKYEFYKPSLKSHSVYGKIQAIVDVFSN